MATTTLTPELRADTKKLTLQKLNTWNKWLAAVYAVQGIVILLLSATVLFPVQTSYLALDPLATEASGHPVMVTATRHLFDVNLAYLVAASLFIPAIAHIVLATVRRKRYEAGLKQGVNGLRWIEYGLSSSVMLLVIGLLSGIADLSTLLLIFALSLVVNLLGLVMEIYNQGKAKPNWLARIIGCSAGLAPWVVFGLYAWGANIFGATSIPAYLGWIYALIFVLFNSLTINMYLQYEKIGPWKEYLYGERVYMLLGLIAKTLLAWLVFAGALHM